ncbi:DUF721 domain-containing protein [Proteus sp. DFP240708]|uniref:DUF721 domain-containing protein n=1 Tax=Proteus TaxID=583 RepID=UPI000D69FA26|nr:MULTISPECIES: DciA family protein [Proteus]MBG2800786.1 DUF721 domain-containing protein [Proteus mirabilis]MBG3151958.1 DUF721 domain-containing protein [Proteus mirabilis]MBI6217842.1 DUF721 domain-containing protein [Proteus vulgaris]MBI6338096.1 DUF721 domain-containing protein [Proteus sp. PR00224]MBI6406566.1 DUF721 domain-containing protein [Proteus sp. PR00208]
MRDSYPQSLEKIFIELEGSNKSTLQLIQQRATILLKLNRAVMALLPVPLRDKCRVANYRNAILIIEVANASWLTRLRYETPSLLSALRQEILPSLSSIDIKINPSLGVKQEKRSLISSLKEQEPKKKRHLSLESAQSLKYLAEKSPKKLRERLERLAALAGESTSTAKDER